MDLNLWIFDYDNTLMPAYISYNIVNKKILNEIELTEIISVLLNIILTIKKIKEMNGKIIILTAALEPWVETTLIEADLRIKENKHKINYNLLKDNIIYYNYNNIKQLLNIDNFFTKHIKSLLNNEIYYVHNIERQMNNIERYNKKNSLKYIIHKNNGYNNIIILGDAYDNERKHTIELLTRPDDTEKNKKIKFVQYYNTNNITLKLHEQHLLYYNITHIINMNDNVIYDINDT